MVIGVTNNHENRNCPRYIVLAERCDSGGVKLHFNAHYDVVPGGVGWLVTEPFKPILINGRVYGRGASDDKGGVTALILLAKRIGELREFDGCVEFSFTPDEEVGGFTGVNYLLGSITRPDYAVVAEPTGLGVVWVGSMGMVQLDVVIRGVPAHASQSQLGVNAFEDGVKVAYAIITGLKGGIEGRSYMGERAVMTLGGFVKGGLSRNIVPDYFSFSIDRRLLPNEDVNESIREIMDYIEEIRGKFSVRSAVDVYVINTIDAALNREDSMLVKGLVKAIGDVVHLSPKLMISRTPVDTRYFQRSGTDAVTYGPGDISSAHGPDEYISVDDIIKASEVYLRLIDIMLNDRTMPH
jgi:Acetylornithine deacetylase/Succinyl-diaminopimelate desuccinylase and related deacylases